MCIVMGINISIIDCVVCGIIGVIIMLVLLIVILTFILLYILALRTNSGRQDRFTSFKEKYIAHRGLFDNKTIPENSESAFEVAVENGYGIELDVQSTKDGKLVVFHDATLKRMCGVDKRLEDCTYEELLEYRLVDTEEKIPLFDNALEIVGGKVPLVVEIKSEGDFIKTTQKVAECMAGYRGDFCIESFNPFVVAWFNKYRPNVLRGILSTDYKKNKINRSPIERFILTNLLLNWYAKPDFISYNHKYCRQFSYKLCKWLYNPVNVAWTIRSQEELDKAKDCFEIFIFDSFIPDKDK